ncbi:hypothetical protein Btru_068855 [Bulinus truncatus]|nr:hypothetical protein Btru_068855 [Bulinus truncatus]
MVPEIAFQDLVQFIEEHGVKMQARFQDFSRRSIDNLGNFIFAVKNTLLATQEVLFLKRGFNAARAYLNYFISQHPYTKKRHNK